MDPKAATDLIVAALRDDLPDVMLTQPLYDLADDIEAGRMLLTTPIGLRNQASATTQLVEKWLADKDREIALLRNELAEAQVLFEEVRMDATDALPMVKALREVAKAAKFLWEAKVEVHGCSGPCPWCDTKATLARLEAAGVRL